ncbi:MAG: AAA-like domain-containing protein [Cyanobacteria bacterium P01_D01_bin.44]
MKTILILAANPKGTTQLRLDKEVREIEEGLRRSEKRECFILKSRWATRPLDMQRAILEEKPQIVHFSGHGVGDEGIVLEDNRGKPKLVTGNALAKLFKLVSDQVECVLLNACHSQKQAEAIAEHIDAVIGMSQAVGDQTAQQFAIGFYDALGAGRDLDFAHEWGCTAIEMEGLDESLIPVMLHKPGKQAKSPPSSEKSPPVQPFPTQSARLFISYKRDVTPDETLALELFQALGQTYEVAIDQSMLVGTKWQAWIDNELRQSDFLIVLLSEASMKSEMVIREIQKAHKLANQEGRPKILPVRLAYKAPFHYPLSEYLNDINWAFWQDDSDTPGLIADLQRAIAGGDLSINTEALKQKLLQPGETKALPAPNPMAQPLELPEGTMDLESKFYVERASDAVALDTIRQQGVTITIKGPRQMGKSSLLIRTMNAARKFEKRVVFLDFQFFDSAALLDADLFYRQFCQWLTLKLRLVDQTEQWWQMYGAVGNPLACTFYLQDYLLPELKCPVVLAMDEVESTFSSPFRTDFFGMLRGWHNSRATEPIWKQMDLVLVTSTEPYQLIQDMNQSPFNVGQVIDLADFSTAQVADLNQRHGNPFSVRQLEKLMALLNGHPYLVRRALYLVASDRMSVETLFQERTEERGPFGDHLRYHLSRVYNHKTLVKGLLQVFSQQICPDEGIFFRLRGAGLIRREGQKVVLRCQLYAEYFQEHLSD